MTAVAQFVFIDGGERAPNNGAYYSAFGISTGNIGTIPTGTTGYFHSGNHDSTQSWTPPGVSYTTFYFGVRSFIFNPSYQYRFINANNNIQFYVYINGANIQIYRGDNTLLGQAAYAFPGASPIYLEVHGVISATVGAVSIRLNGNPTPVINVSGINTAYDTTSLPIVQFFISEQTNNYDSYIRDMYFHDGTGSAPFNNFLGDVGCQLSFPSANVSTQFTPIGNSLNYENVANAPPSSADYNESSTIGNADVFSITALKSNTVTVFGVSLFDYSYKDDSGSRALAKTLTSSGTTIVGATNYLGSAAAVTQDTYTIDPHTSSAFTPSGVNALNVGYKIIA